MNPKDIPPDGNHDPRALAGEAHLRYVHDVMPGIRRLRKGKGFVYHNAKGRAVQDKDTLERIRSLVLPPAWNNVWICPIENGHLQATGIDAKGRKQYRYHPRWQKRSHATTFARMLPFGKALPKIRHQIRSDMSKQGMPREKVIAALVMLLDSTGMRIGSETYARENKSYGLSTLRVTHVHQVRGKGTDLRFRGKGGKMIELHLEDRRLARIIAQCRDLPGQELFTYKEEGVSHAVHSEDVNAYIHVLLGDAFTAKDFRTWHASVLALQCLRRSIATSSHAFNDASIRDIISETAECLRNTPAVCRKHYIHPRIISETSARDVRKAQKSWRPKPQKDLKPDEQFLLHMLKTLWA